MVSFNGKPTTSPRWRVVRKLLRGLLWLIVAPFLLLALVAILIYLPPVQNMLRAQVIGFLEKKIGRPVQLEHLALRYPLGLSLEGLYVQDQNGDTLFFSGSLKARVSVSALLRKSIDLSSVDLSDARVIVLQAKDSTFNFTYIIDAFAGKDTLPKEVGTDTTAGWSFTIEEVALENVRADLDLEPSHLMMALRLGNLDLDLDEFDPKAKRFYGAALSISDTRVDMRTAPGPSLPDSYPLLKNPLAKLDVRLEELALANVGFTMANTATGDSLWLDLTRGEVAVNAMDPAQQQVELDLLRLDGPRFGMVQRGGRLQKDSIRVAPPWLDQNDAFRFWVRDWNILAKEVRITNGDVQLHTDHIAPPALLFDPQHIAYTAMELDARDLLITNAHIAADIRELSASGGPHATPLHASLKVDATPALFAITSASLNVGGNAIDFSASARPGDLSKAYRVPEQVPLIVHLGAEISAVAWQPVLADLGIPFPERAATTEKLDARVAFIGTVHQIDTLRLDMAGDQGTVVHLHGKATDILDRQRTTFDADLDQLVMGDGLHKIARAYLPNETMVPTRLSGQLHATGSRSALSVDLRMSSDLGDIAGAASANLSNVRMPDALHADLIISDFQVQRFTGDTSLGPVSLRLLADGERLNSSDRSGHLEVIPTRLAFHRNDLSSLRITGDLARDSIHARITTDAPALGLALQVRGRWPGREDSLAAGIALHVERLHLQALGLMDHPLNVDGEWQGDIALSADRSGHFALTGDSIRLSNPERSFLFPELITAARLGKDSTSLSIESDALEVAYTTNMRIDSVVPGMRAKLFSYFQADSSFTPVPGKHMDLRVAMPNTEWLTGLVLPQLQEFELKTFTGHYDSDKDALDLDIDIPRAVYRRTRLAQVTMQVKAAGSALNGGVSLGSAAYDSLRIEHLTAQVVSAPGALLVTLREQHPEKEPNYNIPLEFTRLDGRPVLHIREGLLLDTLAWTADPANKLVFAEQGPMAEHFILQGGSQHVSLLTDASATHLVLDQYDLGTLVNFVSTSDTVQFVAGFATGELSLPLSGASGLRADMKVKDLAVTGTRLGDASLNARETRPKNYEAEAHLANGVNLLDASVSIDAAQARPTVDAHTTFDLKDIAFLRPFASSFLYDLSGGLGADLRFTLHDGRSDLQGDLSFNDAAVGVRTTKSRYTLKKENITFDNDGVHLDHFTLRDSLNNAFTLDGDVHTTDYASMRFDLTLRTDAFQLAHSTPGSNKFFYGDLLAGIDLRITGTDRAPVVKGDLHILPGTDLSVILPGSKVRLIKSEGIVEFTTDLRSTDTTAIATDAEVMRDSLKAQLPKIDLDLGIRIDDQAQFAVVLDPTTGDAATFQGDGDLRFKYSADGDMYLSGPFTITQGGYTLEFYGLVKKRFDLVSGSTVTWSGDPLAAAMDIKARYISESASYPLVANATGALSEVERNRLQAPLPYEVLINIQGEVKKPDITFGLDLDRSYRNSYPQVNDQLDRLADATHADERNRQVFGLLVLNSFIQDESSGGAPSSGIATSAARSSVNGLLTDQMNKLTGRFIKGVDIQLGVNTVDQSAGNDVYQRTSVDYKVSKSFLNKRLSFEVGGSVGVNEQELSVSNVSSTRAAQYAILYDLTRDGRFRLRGFYENAFDLYDGEITDSGIALMYTREFEENETTRARAREAARLRKEEERRQAKEKEENERQRWQGTTPVPGTPAPADRKEP
jgi:translocation and assembly module TamB